LRNETVPIIALLLLCAAGGIAAPAAPVFDLMAHPRAVGLGGAFTAVADDAAAAWWNPSGLDSVMDMDIQFMHQNWFLDSDFEYVAFARRFDRWTFGSSLAYFHMAPIPIVNAAGQDVQTASVFDLAVLMSAATHAAGFSFGANFKTLVRSLDGDNGALVCADLAIGREFSFLKFYKTRHPNANLALVAKDLSTPLIYKEGTIPVLPRAGIGLRWEPYRSRSFRMLLASDLLRNFGDAGHLPTFAGGMEFGFADRFFLRAGLRTEAGTVRPSAGAGFNADFGGLALAVDLGLSRDGEKNLFATAVTVRNSQNRTRRVRIAPKSSESSPSAPASGQKSVVGFVPFRNLTGKKENDFLSRTIPESVQTVLTKNTNIMIMDIGRVERMAHDEAGEWTVPPTPDDSGPNLLVTGSFVEIQGGMRVTLKVIDTRDSRLIYATSVDGNGGKALFGLIDRIAAELNEHFDSQR
jgi:TolB-like protein